MRFPGFIGPSYQLNSVNVDCQRCINLYPEVDEIGTGKEKEVAALVGTPGLTLWGTIGDGPIRGMYVAKNQGTLYAVSGNVLYSVDSAGTGTSLGTINSPLGPVSFADNGVTMVLVDGEFGYQVTLADNTFSEITDTDFTGADQVWFLDGFFVFNHPGTGQYFISGNYAVTFDALDYATAESSPDNLKGIAVANNNLWLFGGDTIEVAYNSGAADFPFERIRGAVIGNGVSAAFSIANMEDTLYWLGSNKDGAGIVYRNNGYQPMRISTHAVENAIRGYGDVSGTTSYTYQESGHKFYALNFENADTTWVFDATTNLWHERSYLHEGVYERHRAECHAFAYSKHVVGDYANGKLYEMSLSSYSDNGDPIARRRRAPHFTDGLKLVSHHSFQLDIEAGVGLDGLPATQGTDPQMILRFSGDGGHSWSNEKQSAMGKIGAYGIRAIWRRLGMSRDRVYELTSTDPVKQVWIGAELEVEGGAA